MYLLTAEQMRQVDYKTITEFGIPEIVLMENAGRAIVSFLQEHFEDLQHKAITILAGAGNNGGDGLVVARYLHYLGAKRGDIPHAKSSFYKVLLCLYLRYRQFLHRRQRLRTPQLQRRL